MNPPEQPVHPLDRFAQSHTAAILAFFWGMAEATWFFIVPDVLLTFLACRSMRASLKASGAAIAGALLGGIIMCQAGSLAPEPARAWMSQLPGIDPPLIDRVRSQLAERGPVALLIGPVMGIPYKIYAVEWGAQHGGLLTFALLSIPARGIRFLLSVVLAYGLARALARWTLRRPKVELTILATVWLAFYAYYFAQFGW